MPKSFWGTGTALYGKRDFRRDDSYLTTEFIAVFGVAIAPLRSLRLRNVDTELSCATGVPSFNTRYAELARTKPHARQVLSVYGFEFAEFAFVVGYANAADRFQSIPYPFLVLGAIVGVTLIAIVPWHLRQKARQRAK